jgi:hypothetical protein
MPHDTRSRYDRAAVRKTIRPWFSSLSLADGLNSLRRFQNSPRAPVRSVSRPPLPRLSAKP